MMDGVKDKPSLEEMLRHSKIVSVYKECTRPKTDNLKRILEAMDETKFKNDHPVAIVAIIGPKGSGKSFLTNFLIHNLKQGGEGGWMSSLMSQNGFGEGFSFGDISSEKFYEPDPTKEESSGTTSGVYLWPEPFLMTGTGTKSKNLVVWVMHVHSVQDDSKENLAALERFLMLTCSRIMEIKWKNDEEFRMLQHSQFLSDFDLTLQKQICDSVVYTFRSGNKISADTDDEAIETLQELLQEAGEGKTGYMKSLRNCKHVNITWMSDIPQPLHDNNGEFSTKMKTAQKPIRNIVDKMLEESEIDQKSGGNHKLTLGNMVQFLEAAASTILASGPDNSLSPDEKPVDNDSTCQVPNPENLVPTKSIATTTSNLSNGNITTPPLQRDRNYESSTTTSSSSMKNVTTTSIKSLLQSNGENPRHLIKSREARESFFSGMSLLATNAKVERGNETCLLSADKGEKMKNDGVNKDHNQNFGQTVKQEIHQPPAAAPVSPAATSKPNNYDQKREALNNLDSQMEVDQPNRYEVLESSIMPEPEECGRNSTEPMDVDDDSTVEEAIRELQDGKSNDSEFKKRQQTEEMVARNLERGRKREEKKLQEENQKKDQEKKKKEEEKRRQEEEEAKKEMIDCVNIAVLKIRLNIPAGIKSWINHRLSFSTVNQMEGIYADAFRTTTEEHRQAVDPKLWNEFISRVDNHCIKECILNLKCISELVLQLNRAVKKQFDFHGYFNASKLEKMFSEEFQKLKIPQDEFIIAMTKLATNKLLHIYQQHNELIIDEEKNNFKIATSQIENLYHEQMKRYMEFAPYSPQKLDKIHQKLVEKLVGAFKKAFHLSNTVNNFITSLEEPLKESLRTGYKSYETNNDTKLRILEIEINKIISKSKMKYTEDIEAVLKQYPDGVEMRVLTKHNDSIRAEAMKLLEMEIRPKRENEPVEIHQKVLQNYIDSYWPTVMSANQKNFERKKERDEEEQRQQKKVEAQRKLQQEKEATEERKSWSSSTTVPQPKHHQNKSNRKSMTQEDGKPELSTPLIFNLQSSRIVMAMDIDGHPTVLENESGEMQTPAWVAFTSKNKFVYGSEAFALAHQDQSYSEPDILIWSVADFFLNSDNLFWSKRVCINGMEHVITSEFVLAVLLSNLKETIEQRMGSQLTATVIAIPFSFSSPQRIQLKDAAKIAGFSEVYLVNEASAAAYNFVLSDMRSSAAEVLVLSENIDRVDAFVYSYNTFDKKLKMLGHAGNYEDETNRKKAWSFKKFAKGILNFVLSYVSTDEGNSKHDDSTSRTVRNACKYAINEANKVEPNEYLYICENSNRWSVMLSSIAKDFGRKACDINEESAVISGAVVLARNPKEIGRFIRDKLAYDVLRPAVFSGYKVVSSKKEPLPENLKKQNATLHIGVTATSIYQDVSGTHHEIGKLTIDMRLNYDQYIEPSLDITNEGIVKFKSATLHTNRSNLKSRVICNVPEESITWLTPNLSEEALATMASLLDSITVPKEDPPLVKAKTCVIEKSLEMQEKIAADKFKLKSDLAKEMVLKKIEEAKQFASHAKTSLDDINKQMDSLQRLCDKYEKK